MAGKTGTIMNCAVEVAAFLIDLMLVLVSFFLHLLQRQRERGEGET